MNSLSDRLGSLLPSLTADWRNFVFLHFAITPAELAPHVSFPLDVREGKAFVSLVSFRLTRMRPANGLPPWLGRCLLRPISDHNFLNVRTYVRGPSGPGIHFLAEWVNNAISWRIGPVSHGLPYRLGRLENNAMPSGGLRRIAVRDRATGKCADFVVPVTPDHPPRPVASGSREEFLFERYLAYSHCGGVGRCFPVSHAPWRVAPFALARFDHPLLEDVFPWFGRAEFMGGHTTDDLTDVFMGAPKPVTVRSRVFDHQEELVDSGTGLPAQC